MKGTKGIKRKYVVKLDVHALKREHMITTYKQDLLLDPDTMIIREWKKIEQQEREQMKNQIMMQLEEEDRNIIEQDYEHSFTNRIDPSIEGNYNLQQYIRRIHCSL